MVKCSKGVGGELEENASVIGYVMTCLPTIDKYSALRGRHANAAKSSTPSFDTPPSFSHHHSHQFALVRLTMFSRTLPRAAPRISALGRCQGQPSLHRFTELSTRTRICSPLQHQLGRRYRSSISATFREQYRKSPVLFPFAVVM